MKTFLKLGTLLLASVMPLAGCNDSGASLEGAWVEDVPGMPGMQQGVQIEAGGRASSINMQTLRYEAWKQQGSKLILSGKSIGNGQTIAFEDTFEIESVTPDSLILKRGMLTVGYGRKR